MVGDGTAGVTHLGGLAALAAFGPVAHFGSSAPFERGGRRLGVMRAPRLSPVTAPFDQVSRSVLGSLAGRCILTALPRAALTRESARARGKGRGAKAAYPRSTVSPPRV